MYRNKKEVDKHVDSLMSKLSLKEFKTRAYSVARLYYEVGDYASCQRYVEQYLTQKDNNAAAHKLLGQALQKLGQKEKALEQYKTSLELDPTQTSTTLDICELLADDEVVIDPGRARYWCEKAEATFPRHPVTFRLREKLTLIANPDPEALVKLLTAELEVRPKDAALHARLLRHYLQNNDIKKAFDHSYKIEFCGNTFLNNFAWYETLTEILKQNLHDIHDWTYQLLLLTVRERICLLSLTETPSGSSKSLGESNDLLHAYDQAIECVAKAGASPGFGEFHASLLQHHRGQFAFHAATFLLKKAKKDQLSWRDATKFAAPLMLIAWQTVPLDSKVNWLTRAPEKQQNAVNRWYYEGTYRCSQSGHYLLSNIQDKSQTFLDRIAQCCSGSHWRDKIYEKLFANRDQLTKIKSSHFVSNAFSTPILRLPRRIEVEAFDEDGQRQYASSLHHFVWILSNYKNFAHFKCTIFDMLTPHVSSCGPETLNKHDVHAFLYCATLTSRQRRSNENYAVIDRPSILPANITDLLCPLSQIKWWDCAYKFSQNELGTELTDIRSTLSRGIEVVRCVDNHGLDPELLCILGRIFSERAKLTTTVNEKNNLEMRSSLYYSSAIPLLEKFKKKLVVKLPEKRMFDYVHKELSTKDLNSLIEESKLYLAVSYLNDGEYEKVIDMLSNLKSPQAYYHLGQTYQKIAQEDFNLSRDNSISESKIKHASLLAKAKSFAYKAIDRLKETETNKKNSLYSEIQELIEDIETKINKVDLDLSGTIINDGEGKYSSDENASSVGSENLPIRPISHVVRNLSSTPKQSTNSNVTNYRTAVDSQIFETTQQDHRFLERIENQIKSLQKRDTTINDFMEQTKQWFEENRKIGTEIISTIQINMLNTTDQFKLLKISVDQVKGQIDECRTECKDVGELKKQIAELKKEVNKLKKVSSEQTVDENDLYNLDDDYRANENTATFAAHLPFTANQMVPPFNQRLVPQFPVPPPNPYQLYGQNLFNLYSQYPQFGQHPTAPGASTMFDPTRPQVNYSGVFPTPDQMYLDVAHLVPPVVPTMPTVPTIPTVPTLPTVSVPPTIPVVSVPPSGSMPPTTVSKPSKPVVSDSKDNLRALPVNVVITSSDPLPTCTTTPAPVLSVTIPPKHIKGTPHNYQIPMPSTNENKIIPPPVFSFPNSTNKFTITNTTSSVSNWNQSTVFKNTFATESTATMNTSSNSGLNSSNAGDNSRTVVDGIFTGPSPNTSVNKSRTLSERSNTSIENYDPCPDFKPIVPLPDEVKVTTGEEDETVIFSSRAKLFRFVDKQWKERGLGEMKLLKHKISGKVRVLMRREQVHKICANHIITSEMEIKPMKNETKAYFWVANDFAEESLVLEKFCIRFKTTEIATLFYDTFEKARKDSSTLNKMPSTPKSENAINFETSYLTLTQQITTSDKGSEEQPGKAVFGGFTFSSTPVIKPVADASKSIAESSVPATTKVNVFGGLTFKATTSSPFSSLFNTSSNTSNQNVQHNNQMTSLASKQETTKLNTSDNVEEFEPNVQFEPVVPLPALIEQKTGEEDEIVLFEYRAKLLRFDSNSKEWKERGLGNIKLLVHKDNVQKVRLLMRREQIMKVCCNHAVTKDMIFQKMTNMDKAVTWCAKDFSEGTLVAETFCLRFKTVEVCDNFMQAVKMAQSKMKDESKAAKEEQNAAKQGNQVGFGDKFKPKSGSWYCETCYTNNLESFLKCACCDTPKPQDQTTEKEINSSKTTNSANWGDKFKPKPGSWECKSCLIRNDAVNDNCNACNSPKDPSAVPNTQSKPHAGSKFNFGIPKETVIVPVSQTNTVTPVVSNWGDKFKPKEGTWECAQCFVRNESNVIQCSACSSPNPNAVKKEIQSVFGPTSTTKFNFGIPLTATGDQNSKTETTSIFDGTGTHNFKFGIPTNTPDKSGLMSFGEQKPVPIEVSKLSTEKEGPINFSLQKNNEDTKPPVKPALLPTPKQENATPVFGSKQGGTFDFVFKPKTPQSSKGKSPAKSPRSQKGDDSDGEEYVSEDEGHHIHFSPVIPMPDKIDVVTGEENEDELYGHRAKLFRFAQPEWKERGIGVVKLLKHKETGKLRVIMRREQVLKICLNHALTPDVTYVLKDEKTWFFTANDFSEGTLNVQQFCLRFKTKEIAQEFKDAIDKALEGKCILTKDQKDICNQKDSDDVLYIGEIEATEEEKQMAKELMLPENFYTYKKKDPCQGCRGCKDTDESEINLPSTKENIKLKAPAIATCMASTPVKTCISSFQTPTSSIFGSPASLDKTVDNSIYRTPLGSIGSNNNIFTSFNNTLRKDDTTNKENSFKNKDHLFAGSSEKLGIIGTPHSKSATQFSAGDTPTSANKVVLAAPKLGTLDISSNENKKTEPANIFGSAQNKPILSENKIVFGENKSTFGAKTSSLLGNKSIFGLPTESDKNDSVKTEAKSIFGIDDKPVNLFSGAAKSSLFGPGALNTQSGVSGSNSVSIFGSDASKPKLFGNGQSLFQNTSNQTSSWTFSSSVEQKKPEEQKIDVSLEKKPEKPVAEETPFKVDNALSFAALSTAETNFNKQKMTDFKWEGAGQPLFVEAQKTTNKEKEDVKNESGAADNSTTGTEEEYDPHYEPIVPLPDKIVVTTGEEDEEKIFGERCKLYRFNENREWKERGVGEMKILYHPERKTYRLLLRREQVHKAVLNMLIFMDMELLPMKNSDRAWSWAARNFGEDPAGPQETLAVRFKTVPLANSFRDKVNECIRKLQAAAADAIRQEQESKAKPITSATPLRLPKHLQDNARADNEMSAPFDVQMQSASSNKPSTDEVNKPSPIEMFKQVHFQEAEEHAEDVEDEGDEDYNYDHHEDYAGYYEDEEESAAYYSCDAEAVVRQGSSQTVCELANIQVLFDQDIYSPKILITDHNTGEILADMLIHTDTEFQMSGDSCSWSGEDYTTNDPVEKSVTINFHDSETAMQFYDSCETSKAATYSSTDPES